MRTKFLFMVLLVVLIIAGIFFYRKYEKKEQDRLMKENIARQEKLHQEIVEKISTQSTLSTADKQAMLQLVSGQGNVKLTPEEEKALILKMNSGQTKPATR